MEPITIYVGVLIGLAFITMVLFVAFGQITVRKLRKNSKTKDALGVEFASGWDILNVAQALAIPRSWAKKLEDSKLSFFYADSEVLYKHTSRFDRALARIFWWFYFITGSSSIVLVALSGLGVFGE